jgi:hypothetical protein
MLEDLVSSQDLDSKFLDQPTLELASGHAVWTRATKGTGAAINTNCNP